MEDIIAITKIMKRHSADQSKERNIKIMEYLNFKADSQSTEEIMSNLYDSIIEFGITRREPLTRKKMACLLLIITEIQSTICSTDYTSPKEAFNLFQTLLVQYSVQRPPFSIVIFAFKDIMPITEFILETYFKHYKAYQVAFGLNINATTNDKREEEHSGLSFTEIEATILNQHKSVDAV